MASIVPSKYLKVDQYFERLNLNPENVKYKFLDADNPTLNNSQFKIFHPSSNSMLSALVLWEITVRFGLFDNAGNPANIPNDEFGVLGLKPFLPMQGNAVTNMNLSWNGYTASMRPRDFVEIMGLMFAGREGSKKLSSGGGEFNNYNAISNLSQLDLQTWSNTAFTPNVDPAFFKRNGRLAPIYRRKQGTNFFDVTWYEPLIIPPFTPFSMWKNNIPKYCWFAHMSNMIPYFDNATLQIDYEKIETCVEFIRSSDNAAQDLQLRAIVVPNTGGLTRSRIHMWWYEPPKNIKLDTQYVLQTWWTNRQITNLPAIVANAELTGEIVSNIRLSTTPTLITIHCGRRKSAADYGCVEYGQVVLINARGNSRNSMLSISNLNIDISTKDRTLNSNLTQAELHLITIKNSIKYEFPYEYDSYTKGNNMFVALRPEDISQDFPAGVNDSITLDVTCDVRNNSLYAEGTYDLIVTLYYGQNFIIITPNEITEKKVNIPLETARRILYIGDRSTSVLGAGLSRTQYVSRV